MKLVSLKELKAELAQLGRLLKPIAMEAYAFGSVLTGAVPQESDLDVLIIPKGMLSYASAYEKAEPVFVDILRKGLVLHLIIASGRHGSAFLRQAKSYRIL